jgi:hypothetical protein
MLCFLYHAYEPTAGIYFPPLLFGGPIAWSGMMIVVPTVAKGHNICYPRIGTFVIQLMCSISMRVCHNTYHTGGM